MATPTGVPWGASLPKHLRLRRALASDRDFLITVFSDGRLSERLASGATQTMWDAFIADQFVLRVNHYAREFPVADRLIVEAARGTIGRERVGTLTLAPEKDAVRIVDIGLIRAAQGTGIGTALIHGIAEAARRRRCSSVVLSVQDTNPAAERLYTRLGFVIVEEKRPYASDLVYREMRLSLRDASASAINGQL